MERTIKRILCLIILCLSASVVSLSLYGIHARKSFGGVVLRGHRQADGDRYIQEQVRTLVDDRLASEKAALVRSISACYAVVREAVIRTGRLKTYILSQNGKIPLSVACKESVAFLRYSRLYAVPLDLVVAVANTESHFKPQAKSSHGSAGVMQVTWKVHEGALRTHGFTGPDDLHDPALGIKAGCLVLSRYMEKHQDLKTALGRYYGGSPAAYWNRISKSLKRYRQYEKTQSQK